MEIQVVNKTSTAGQQEQEQEQKLSQGNTIPCILGMFQARYHNCHFRWGKEKTTPERQLGHNRKSHVRSWILNNSNLKSHCRRIDFFFHPLKHLPDYNDKVILRSSL